MILLVHLLLGALIGKEVNNPYLAIPLAFLSHYFLDLLPHIEYPIENITKKQWSKSFPDFIKVFLDIFLGLLLIFLFSKNHPIIYVCAFFAILPDGIAFLSYFIKSNFVKKHTFFHSEKIHFLKNKKISIFWRVASQVIVTVICVIVLKI